MDLREKAINEILIVANRKLAQEVDSLRVLLEKVLPVVEAVARGVCCHIKLSEDGFGCIIATKEVSHLWDKQAQTLLPEIKRVMEEKG